MCVCVLLFSIQWLEQQPDQLHRRWRVPRLEIPHVTVSYFPARLKARGFLFKKYWNRPTGSFMGIGWASFLPASFTDYLRCNSSFSMPTASPVSVEILSKICTTWTYHLSPPLPQSWIPIGRLPLLILEDYSPLYGYKRKSLLAQTAPPLGLNGSGENKIYNYFIYQL